MPGDEARDQAGLTDPRLTLDQHHPGPAAPHSLHLGVENRQLARPANEMVHFSSVDTAERLTQTPARLGAGAVSATSARGCLTSTATRHAHAAAASRPHQPAAQAPRRRAALETYFETLSAFDGEPRPDPGVIRGWTCRPTATTAYAAEMAEVIRTVVSHLREMTLSS